MIYTLFEIKLISDETHESFIYIHLCKVCITYVIWKICVFTEIHPVCE